jgi:HD-like signal output (HDOD) protein/CheY-like chemotaxis protein
MCTQRILFVENQSTGNKDIEQIHEHLTEEWESKIVYSGEEAIKEANELSYNIVLCRMHLSDMLGTELLKRINSQHSDTLRFMMVDKEVDRHTLHDSWSVVHQFISSPCKPESIVSIIGDSMKLHNLLSNKELCAKIAAVGTLPSLPEIHNKLVDELKNENTSIQKIASLVGQDVGITAKVLATANSAFFGLRNRVENITQAINTLGIDTVEGIVFAAGVFGQFSNPNLPGFSLETIQHRGIAVGTKARMIAHAFGLNNMLTNDSLLAGTLHAVGQLVMLTSFKDEFIEALDLAKKESISFHEAQMKVMGVSDAVIGAYLLSLWGLRDTVVEAVAWHHNPRDAATPIISPLTAVHLAYATDFDERNNIKKNDKSAVDATYIDALGMTNQLDSIRSLCNSTMAHAIG